MWCLQWQELGHLAETFLGEVLGPLLQEGLLEAELGLASELELVLLQMVHF